MKYNIDYVVLRSNSEEDYIDFKILTGQYEGIIFKAYDFKFEEEEGVISFKILSLTTDTDTEVFQKLAGQIIYDLITQGMKL
jgi:hypothetical protein